MGKFKASVLSELVNKIDSGEIKVTSPRQIEGIFQKAIAENVKEHLDFANQANDLKNISEPVRRSLRRGAIVAEKSDVFKIQEFAPLAAKIDLSALREAALRKPYSKEAIAPALKALSESIAQIGVDKYTSPVWVDMGVDGQQPFANILIKCALTNDPELAKIIGEHAEELMREASALIPPQESGTMAILSGILPAIKELAEEL